jgi:death-on-curing protein
MRYLTLNELLEIYRQVMAQSGGAVGIRDLNALEAAVAQPRATYGGEDLYPTQADKAAILGYLLVKNHPFIDGNKRIGHAAMEVFLLLNGYELQAAVDEQEAVILSIAAGQLEREAFTHWLTDHLCTLG